MTKFNLIYNIIFTILGWLATIISIFSLEIFSPYICITITVAAVIFLIIYIILQIKKYKSEFVNSVYHNSKEEVNKYLLDWLNSGGRTVIFTRDLTWADESIDIKNILQSKARKNELTICLYQNTQTTIELQKIGAKIYVHNLPDNQLKSRFTIVDYGTNNPKITVGLRLRDGKFLNERYDMNNNPNACQAFIELFEFVKRMQN